MISNGIKISPVNMEERAALGLRAGDTVRVHQKVTDNDGKTRLQVFEGIVIACKHGREAGGTFTVRKVVGGIGVERIFPLYSPMIEKVEIIRRAKVRQSKLYHIREKAMREIRRQMRNIRVIEKTQAADAETETAEDVPAAEKTE